MVFAKAPVPGRVKTRLAKRYGERGAASLYRKLLRQTLAKATAAPFCPVQMWCAPTTRHAFFTACRREYDVELRMQQGADLGQRMAHAFARVLSEHTYALLIGGDCASLETADFGTALAALEQGKAAVLGPAEDGGYLLIGLRRPCHALFRGMDWDGRRVMAATRRRLQRAGLTWLELPRGWDVDRPADVRRFKRLRSP